MAVDIRSFAPRLTLIRGMTALPEWLTVTLIYGLLIWVCFWPAFLLGEAPLPLMNAYSQGDPVWSAYAPDTIARGSNRLLGDVSGFYYPYAVYSIERLRSGDFPLWNPHIFGGVPYFAANQAALLFPINLLAFSFGPVHYWLAAAMLRLMVAGWGMYLLMQRLHVGMPGAILAGAVFMFADFNIVWLHFAIHNVAAPLPLALWLITRLADRPAYRDMLALSGVIAAQMLGGHPEMSLFFMVICGLFALVWSTDMLRAAAPAVIPRLVIRVRSLGLLVLACVLGLGLAAVQWLPTAMLIRDSYTLEERSFAATQGSDPASDYAPLGGVQRAAWDNVRHWMLLVQPQLWGSPRGAAIHNWLPERTNYNEMTPYAGVAALALALVGLLRANNRRAARFFGVMLFGSLILLYPLPGIHRIGFLPLLDIAYGFRFGLGIALATAALAGMGLDALVRTMHRQPSADAYRRNTYLLAAATAAALGGASLIVTVLLLESDSAGMVLGMNLDAAQREQLAAVVRSNNWRLFLPAMSAGVLAITLLITGTARRGQRVAIWSIATVTAAELTAYGFGYNGWSRPEAIYPTTTAIEQLRHDPASRVLPLDDAFWANSAMVHGLQVTSGMDDLKPGDQGRFLKRGLAGISAAGERIVVMDWGQRYMDLMNVRYVATRRPLESAPGLAPLPLELRDGDLMLYRNDSALPRAYTATAFVPATRKNAEDRAFAAGFDPHRAVVLEGDPGLASGAPAPIAPAAITHYQADRVELATDLAHPAVLVLADAYDPDWQVSVNGEPAQLLRANAMFRAVAVPAGRSVVTFVYRPRWVMAGGAIAAISLAAMGILALARLWLSLPVASSARTEKTIAFDRPPVN